MLLRRFYIQENEKGELQKRLLWLHSPNYFVTHSTQPSFEEKPGTEHRI